MSEEIEKTREEYLKKCRFEEMRRKEIRREQEISLDYERRAAKTTDPKEKEYYVEKAKEHSQKAIQQKTLGI
jgi:hypothetical protein